MDCCGHGHVAPPQPWVWSTPPVSVAAMLAGEVGPPGSTAAAQTSETTAAALAVLRNAISVDVHSHGGSTGITSKAPPSGDLTNAMRAGSLAVEMVAVKLARCWSANCGETARGTACEHRPIRHIGEAGDRQRSGAHRVREIAARRRL